MKEKEMLKVLDRIIEKSARKRKKNEKKLARAAMELIKDTKRKQDLERWKGILNKEVK